MFFTKKSKEVVNEIFANEISMPTPIVEKETEKKKKYIITIYLKDASIKNYERLYSLDAIISGIQAYYSFFKWFYLKESPYFTFRHTNGTDIFIRNEIKLISFTSSIVDVEKK